VYHDAAYVSWANAQTIHVMSYSLDKEAEKPEPLVEIERDGAKVETLAMYPMLTPSEAEALVNEVNAAVMFPTSTPWSGVISPLDGKTVLGELTKGTSKEFRALYEAEQVKLGPTLARPLWRKVVASLSASTEAEFDEKFAEAVKFALEAKALVKEPTKALGERMQARLDGLERIGRERLEVARGEKDAAKRAKALAALAADFKGLPVAADAAAVLTAK